MHLEIQVSTDVDESNGYAQNCKITYEGLGKEEVPLDADANLITRTAL
jgi:homoserine kinase